MVNNNFKYSFPNDINLALQDISTKYKLKLLKNTHYNATNRELKWYTKKEIHRLNFNYDEEAKIITITHYIDKVPFCMGRIIEKLHDLVPIFPYLAKIEWLKIGTLPINLTKKEYTIIIENYIKRMLRINR